MLRSFSASLHVRRRRLHAAPSGGKSRASNVTFPVFPFGRLCWTGDICRLTLRVCFHSGAADQRDPALPQHEERCEVELRGPPPAGAQIQSQLRLILLTEQVRGFLCTHDLPQMCFPVRGIVQDHLCFKLHKPTRVFIYCPSVIRRTGATRVNPSSRYYIDIFFILILIYYCTRVSGCSSLSSPCCTTMFLQAP